MAFCMNCGKKIDDGRVLCPECESAVRAQTQKTGQKPSGGGKEKHVYSEKTASGLTSAANCAFSFTASPLSGEVAVGVLLPAGGFANILNPFMVLFGGIKRIVTGFRTVFKDKRKYIPAIILAAVWIVLSLLSMLGIENTVIKVLSLLTFAEGGYSGSVSGVIGGILGKGMVASFFMSLFSGGAKGVAGGAKQIFSVFKNAADDASVLCSVVLGAGVSMVFYNFLTERAVIWQSMAGIAGLFISLRATGSGSGFLREFLTSLTAKRVDGEKRENTKIITSLLSGISYGFALAVLASLIPFAYTPYCVGAMFITASIVLIAVRKFDRGGEGK